MNRKVMYVALLLTSLVTMFLGAIMPVSAQSFEFGSISALFSNLFLAFIPIIFLLFVIGLILSLVKTSKWIKDIFNF